MKYSIMLLMLCTMSLTQLLGQQTQSKIPLGIAVNVGVLKSPIIGIVAQSSFGVSLTAQPHERVSMSVSVAHASTRTEASRQALSFIGASRLNFQSTAIDFTTYIKCWNLNEHVAFYAGFGINQIWSDFRHLGRVEIGEASFDIVKVDQEQVEGTSTSSLGTFALRSNPKARVQVALFGNIALLASRPERSLLSFSIVDRNGNGQTSINVPGPTRYFRAGVEVSYRIRR